MHLPVGWLATVAVVGLATRRPWVECLSVMLNLPSWWRPVPVTTWRDDCQPGSASRVDGWVIASLSFLKLAVRYSRSFSVFWSQPAIPFITCLFLEFYDFLHSNTCRRFSFIYDSFGSFSLGARLSWQLASQFSTANHLSYRARWHRLLQILNMSFLSVSLACLDTCQQCEHSCAVFRCICITFWWL